MRYVKYKTTVVKVVDELIDDHDTIISILNIIKDKELSCAMKLSDGHRLDKVRISDVNAGENYIKIKVLGQYSTLQKTALIDQVEYLEINSSDSEMCRVKPDISRWMLLDPSADFPEEAK